MFLASRHKLGMKRLALWANCNFTVLEMEEYRDKRFPLPNMIDLSLYSVFQLQVGAVFFLIWVLLVLGILSTLFFLIPFHCICTVLESLTSVLAWMLQCQNSVGVTSSGSLGKRVTGVKTFALIFGPVQSCIDHCY